MVSKRERTYPILRANIKIPQHLLARRQPLNMLLMHRPRTARLLNPAPVPLDRRIANPLSLALHLGLLHYRLQLELSELVVAHIIFRLSPGAKSGRGRRWRLRLALWAGRDLWDVFLCAGRGFVAFFAGLDALGDLVLEAEGLLLGWAG